VLGVLTCAHALNDESDEMLIRDFAEATLLIKVRYYAMFGDEVASHRRDRYFKLNGDHQNLINHLMQLLVGTK
jgi:hypothetical protein